MAKKKKPSGVSINLSGVEGRVKLPDGEYRAKVVGFTQEEGSGDHDYLAWQFKTVGNDNSKHDGAVVYTNTSLSPKALWNLRNLLETLGVEIPDDEFDLTVEDVEDKELILVLESEIYEGKRKSVIVDYLPADEREETEEEEEEIEIKGKKSKARDDEEDEKPAKSKKSKKSKKDDDEDSEEEEEDEKPAKKAKKGKKSKELEPLSSEELKEMDEDELEGVNEKYDLGLDLDDYGSARKKLNAVLDALEEKNMLEED